MFQIMAEFDFLDFTPVPVRPRHDGWSPAVQFEFIVALAGGASVDGAARAVGQSRTTAYALRKRAGAASFAAAWESALAYARRERIARRMSPTASLPPQSPADAALVLDSLYPGWRGAGRQAGEAGKAGKAAEADEAERA